MLRKPVSAIYSSNLLLLVMYWQILIDLFEKIDLCCCVNCWLWIKTEAYSEPYKTSKMVCFIKTVNCWNFILQGSDYAFEEYVYRIPARLLRKVLSCKRFVCQSKQRSEYDLAKNCGIFCTKRLQQFRICSKG